MRLDHMLPKPNFPTVAVAQPEEEIKSPTVSPITPVERVDSPGLPFDDYFPPLNRTRKIFRKCNLAFMWEMLGWCEMYRVSRHRAFSLHQGRQEKASLVCM